MKIAVIQKSMVPDSPTNIDSAYQLVEQACKDGNNVVLLPELFEFVYFGAEIRPELLALAHPLAGHPTIEKFKFLAKKYKSILPISYFERDGKVFFNSVAVLDQNGEIIGNYRKSHIPDGVGYLEKFYFSPGNSGFMVHKTIYGNLGLAICWDQWFPETARSLALLGAEILLFPSAIGNEPHNPTIDSLAHWQTTMQGHAGANVMPLVACNRVGVEQWSQYNMEFYGGSFIANQYGQMVQTANRNETTILSAEFDLGKINQTRAEWGLFRDRRPDLYQRILSL